MDQECTRTSLLAIAKLNDEAIYKWLLMPDEGSTVEALLAEALNLVNTLSRDLLLLAQQPHHSFKAADSRKKTPPSSPSTSLFIPPLAVDIDARATTVTYDKAFLLNATIQNCCCDPSKILDSVSIAAAVVFYNIALFFHHRIAFQVTEHQQSLGARIVFQYYEVANKILGKYLERTRRPVWTLQAAILYNLADCTRFQASSTTASCVYFGELEAIVGYLIDQDDRVFFERAIAMTRMQMKQCFCATVA